MDNVNVTAELTETPLSVNVVASHNSGGQLLTVTPLAYDVTVVAPSLPVRLKWRVGTSGGWSDLEGGEGFTVSGPDAARIYLAKGAPQSEPVVASVNIRTVGGIAAGGAEVSDGVGSGITPRIRFVASHGSGLPREGSMWQKTAVSGDQSATYQHTFTLGCDCTDLQYLAINGIQVNGGYVLGNGNAIQIHAMQIPSGGTEYAEISFPGCLGTKISTDVNGGGTAYTIPDKGIIWSMPVAYSDMSKGKVVAYRSYVKVAIGEKYVLTSINRYNAGAERTTDVVYKITTGGVGDGSDWTGKGNTNFSSNYAFVTDGYTSQFHAVIGRQLVPTPAVFVCGDSINAGSFDDKFGRGYVVRACAAAGQIVVNGSCPGGSFSYVNAFGTLSRELAKYADVVYSNFGVNAWNAGNLTYVDDDTTQTGIRWQLKTFIRSMLRPGQTFVYQTQMPVPTGTGSGTPGLAAADYAMQRPSNYEANRIAINNWLRHPTAGFLSWAKALFPTINFKLFDVCPIIERHYSGGVASPITYDSNGQQAVGNGGYYLIGMTIECLHPNVAGNILIAANMPATDLFAI